MLAAAPGLAQTAYVTDQLRLGVHVADDTSDRAFANIRSGDAVQVLQRDGAYARVRLDDGREGWVKATFLVDEAPARTQLPKLLAERDRLRAELSELTGEKFTRADQQASLQQAVAAAEARATVSELRAQEADAQRASLADQLRQQAEGLPRWTLVAGTATGAVAGFWLAWIVFDRRSRRRHGGFRVY